MKGGMNGSLLLRGNQIISFFCSDSEADKNLIVILLFYYFIILFWFLIPI